MTKNDLSRLDREFSVVIEIPVAWGEMDAFGHVNNIIYFRYFESARLAYLERIGFLEELEKHRVGPILASTRCDFRKPLTYPDRVSVGAKSSRLGADRFLMEYRIVSHRLKRTAAEGDGLIVAYDYGTMTRASLPERVRERIVSLDGALPDLSKE